MLRYLTPHLAEAVFSVEFMGKLDEEMDYACLSDGESFTPLYGLSLRDNLMALNRCVVLLYPEYGVHWFHADHRNSHNFDKRAISRLRSSLSAESQAVHEEVSDVLADVLGGYKFFEQFAFSPYHDLFDFEVCVDRKNRRPLAREIVQKYKKELFRDPNTDVVVLLVRETGSNRPKIFLDFDVEIAEAQGYTVKVVDARLWQSLQMADLDSKREHLRGLLGL